MQPKTPVTVTKAFKVTFVGFKGCQRGFDQTVWEVLMLPFVVHVCNIFPIFPYM